MSGTPQAASEHDPDRIESATGWTAAYIAVFVVVLFAGVVVGGIVLIGLALGSPASGALWSSIGLYGYVIVSLAAAVVGLVLGLRSLHAGQSARRGWALALLLAAVPVGVIVALSAAQIGSVAS